MPLDGCECVPQRRPRTDTPAPARKGKDQQYHDTSHMVCFGRRCCPVMCVRGGGEARKSTDRVQIRRQPCVSCFLLSHVSCTLVLWPGPLKTLRTLSLYVYVFADAIPRMSLHLHRTIFRYSIYGLQIMISLFLCSACVGELNCSLIEPLVQKTRPKYKQHTASYTYTVASSSLA